MLAMRISLKLKLRSTRCAPARVALAVSCITMLCVAMSGIAGCGPKTPAAPPFDVPSVIGLKINQVEARLGTGQELPGMSQSDGRKQWRKGGYVLRADYRKRSGRVTSFALGFDDPQKTVKEENKNELLEAARLQENDARYSVEWQEDPDRVERFRSVQVMPAPRQHKVVLRVTGQNLGTTTLVQIAYSVTGNTGENPSENALTLPPWSRQLEAQDGTQIKLEAAPRSARFAIPESAAVTVQIEVDGKVMSQQTASAGGVASCDWEV